jgi:peroxiredoxin
MLSLAAPLILVLAAQAKPSGAAADWQRITDDLAPRIVEYRTLPPEKRDAKAFDADRTRIEGFFRQYEKLEPEYAWSARFWLATNVTRDALEQPRAAADALLEIARISASSEVAGRAAIEAARGLLQLGDEGGLDRLRDVYDARPDRSAPIAAYVGDLCRQVRLLPGKPFPDLALTGLDGAKVDWAALRGRVVLVIVFNVESDASRQALDRVTAIAAAHAKDRLSVVGISLDVARDRLVAELARLKATFTVDFSGKEWNAPAARALGVSQIPVAWLLDGRGVIVESRRGPLPPAFDAAVEHALEGLAPAGGGH